MAIETGRASDKALAWTAFCWLWAAAALFHIASYNQWGQSRLLVFAAVLVLARPSSMPAFLAFVALQIVEGVESSPFIPNHWLLTIMLNAGLLLAMGAALWRREHRRDWLYDAVAPAARLSLVVLYAWVVFHKLNAGFFDSELSCGTEFYAAQLTRLPFLPELSAGSTIAIVLAIAFEAAIPILLLVPRTRHSGILIGAAFHWLLTLNPTDRFYNFTALLFALFALFAAPSVVRHAAAVVGRRRGWLATATLIAALGASALAVREPRIMAALGNVDPFLVLWNVYGAMLIAVYVLAHRQGSREAENNTALQPFLRPRLAVMLVVPLAVAVNGLMPYAGLKTETSWAMFSNLKTEGGSSNHYLVPASAQWFGYQRDLVQVTSSSDRFLQSLADRQLLIPYFEVRRRPGASISYVRDGVPHQFARVADDPAFGSHPSWLLRKLLMFRPVDRLTGQTCAH